MTSTRIEHEVAIIIVRNERGEFLLTHRRADKRVFPNRWGCGAGGKLDAGELPDDAAVRELREETGVGAQPTHRFDLNYEDDTCTSRMHVYDVIANTDSVGFDATEWQAVKWADATELFRLASQTEELCPDTAAMVLRYLADL